MSSSIGTDCTTDLSDHCSSSCDHCVRQPAGSVSVHNNEASVISREIEVARYSKCVSRILLSGLLGLSETLPNFAIEPKQNALQCFGWWIRKSYRCVISLGSHDLCACSACQLYGNQGQGHMHTLSLAARHLTYLNALIFDQCSCDIISTLTFNGYGVGCSVLKSTSTGMSRLIVLLQTHFLVR